MDAENATGDLTRHYQRLNESADQLRALLAQDAAATVAAWDRRIMPLVDEFDQLFKQYLAEKNRDGFMARVLEQRPTKARIVERLRTQADGFIERLSELKASQSGPTSIEVMAGKIGRLRLILDEIKQHQDESNGLAQHVFCQDIGFPGAS